MTKTQKFLIVATSFFVALPSYFLAYKHFSSKLTAWQKEQEIDVFAETGATKFQAYIDSMTVAGICFIVCAVLLLLALKYSKASAKTDLKKISKNDEN